MLKEIDCKLEKRSIFAFIVYILLYAFILAPFCIVGYVFYIFRMLYNGMGQGIQPIVSYNYGEKKLDRVEDTFRIGHKISFGIAIVILIWVNFFGSSLIRLFNEDPELIKTAVHGLRLYASAIIFVGANFINISFSFIGYVSYIACC